ncbi:MAG: transporter substrate-binding domain-containing protein [Clostridiales bacterium]|nr:transporter substrate-binding domain-containing protein [Clostridiales bacterium]
MKKILSLELASVMCIGLASCGTGTKTEENSGKTYVIYSDNSFAPFEYLDSTTNTYVGVDMDILAAVAKDQGFAYEVKNEGFDAAMGAVQSGQADGMIAGMTITDERKKTFDFSDGYFQDGQILVVAKDSKVASESDLSGQKVATKIGTMGTDYAESIKAEVGFETVNYEDSPTMYTAIENGTNAACFEDRSVVEWAIKNENLNLKTVGEVINPKEYGFAVKKGENAELIKMFNDGLKNIKASGEYDKILAKYGY